MSRQQFGAAAGDDSPDRFQPAVEDPLLRVRDLRVGFDTLEGYADVIDGVDLTVGRGEVLAVAGETGCGKSVTMRAIMGLLAQPPAHVDGEVVFDGRDLRALSDAEMSALQGRRISMVFQDPMSSLNPVFTVGEQLTDTAQFGGSTSTGLFSYLRRRLSGEREAARERVLELLEEVRLPDPDSIMDSYPTQLSGGMRQRVLIAQALLNEPDLLIADELGTALDVTIHDQILQLLERLIEDRELSVLMITHNLGAARSISDRIAVMYGGRVVETAPTTELFDSPRHPYTQGLLASIPRLTGEEMGDGIDGAVPEYRNPPTGCRFAPRCPYAHGACEAERPATYGLGPQTGVECVLYDEASDRERPTTEETKQRMAGTDRAGTGEARSR